MTLPWPSRLRTRLVLLALLVAIPAIGYIAYIAGERRSEAAAFAHNGALSVVRQFAARHEEIIRLSSQLVIGLSNTPQIRDTDSPARCNAMVADLHKLHPRMSNVGSFLLSGDIFCTAMRIDRPLNISDRIHFRRVLETRELVVGDIIVSRRDGDVVLPLFYPVIDDAGKFVAVAFVTLNLIWIDEVLPAAGLPEGSALSLLDRDGIILARYPRDDLVGKKIPHAPQIQAAMASGSEGEIVGTGLDGIERVFVFAPFHLGISGKSYLSIGIPTAQIHAASNRVFIRNLLVAAIWTLVLSIALWFGSEIMVMRPIDALGSAAERLRKGDLGVRTGVGSGASELAELAQTFDAMAAELEIREGTLRRVNRTLRVLSASNRALLHAESEDALQWEMCRNAVEIGCYRFAWVGHAEHDERKSIQPVAQYGVNEGFLESFELTWADDEGGQRPAGVALRTGERRVVRDIASGSTLARMREAALRQGFRSVIALPLRIDDAARSVFVLYAAEPNAFSEDEIALLSEFAENLAHGIGNLRLREKHRRAEEELHRAQQRMSLHVQNSPLAVIEWNPAFEVVSWNAAAEKIFGYARTEAIGRHASFILPETVRPHVDSIWADLLAQRGGRRSTNPNLTRDGRTILCEWYNTPLVDRTGRFHGVASLAQDVTEKTRAEERIHYLAYNDSLTDLPNRVQLFNWLEKIIDEAQLRAHSVALLVINVDRFRDVQDSLGPHHADRVLKELAARLRESVEPDWLLARLEVDEFALAVPRIDVEAAGALASKMRRRVDKPVEIAEVRIDVQASVGIAVYPGHARTAAALYQRAERAVIQAKRAKSGYAVASAESDEATPQRLGLVRELREAIESDQLVLHYQPEVDVATGRICGAEALVRWRHPVRGMVPPGEFITIAEHTGLIKPLTYRVLRAALRQCFAWREQGLALPVAVNLSAHNLRDPQLLSRVEGLFSTWGVDPAQLRVEVTETTIMENIDRSMEVLNALKKKGVQIYIDDFGSGYSSLSSLVALPFDFLKIDKIFIDRIATSPDYLNIVSTTISMAHSLRLKVIAEGVETKEQVAILKDLECDELQGFYFSKPVPADEFQRLVESAKVLHAA